MEHNEIIKALESCLSIGGCWDCPLSYDGKTAKDCKLEKNKNALALIKELTEENERLKAENEALAISEVKECEISQMLVYRIRDKHPAVMAVRADTVRKMQTFIEEKADSCDVCLINSNKPIDIIYQISKKQLDQIAKELTDGKIQ